MASEDKIEDDVILQFEKKPQIDNMIVDISNLMYRIIGSIGPTLVVDGILFQDLEPEQRVKHMVKSVINSVMRIKKYYNCDIHICWEGKDNFRFEIYPEYKANRDRTTELTIDVGKVKSTLKEIFSYAKLNQWDGEYCEGDDIMGTLSNTLKGVNCIFSTDRDFFQLLEDSEMQRIFCCIARKSKPNMLISYNDHVMAYGFKPKDRIFIKSLEGDSGDNIKGCLGIGRSYAVKLLKSYETIHNLYSKVETVEPQHPSETAKAYEKRLSQLSLSKKKIIALREHEESVKLALILGKIKTNVTIYQLPAKNIDDDFDSIFDFFEKFGFELSIHSQEFSSNNQIKISSIEEQKENK